MKKEITILSNYLGILPEEIRDLDESLFEDTVNEEMYYVFEEVSFIDYIRDILIPDEIEAAEFDLKSCARHSQYSSFFRVDEDEIEEYVLVNTEEILDTEERHRVTFENEIWLILKAKSY